MPKITVASALAALMIASSLSACGADNVEPVSVSIPVDSDAQVTTAAPETEPSPPAESSRPDEAECERSIAAQMDLDIDKQSKADNIDSIRIDCDMPPLQDTPFWQEAWRVHLDKAGQTQ